MLTTPSVRLRKNPKAFHALTGLDVETFDNLLTALHTRYEAYNQRRLGRPDRQRAIGAGNTFTLALEDSPLMLLIFYRTYVHHVFLGFLFAIDDSTVGRNINPLQPLLAGIFRIPEKRILLSEDEIAKLFFDGTEQPVNRPTKGQRE